MKSGIKSKIKIIAWIITVLLVIWALAQRLTKKESFAAPVSVPVVEAQYPRETRHKRDYGTDKERRNPRR